MAHVSEAQPGPSSAPDAVMAADNSNNGIDNSNTTMSDCIPAPELFMSDEDKESKLTLAYERLFEIPRTIVERYSEHIKYLDISHNKITNLDELVYFKNLTSLIADNNPITENCLLPPLPQLQLLWLNHCKISSLYPWVEKLKESCPNLKYLCLMGNPAAPSFLNGGTFYEYLQYRLFVISQFPSVAHLDERAVRGEERAEARRLYRRPLGERLVRPGAGGLARFVHAPVTWHSIATLGGLWPARRPQPEPELHHEDAVRSRRNLVI